MPSIEVLSDQLVNKIAAGEVIERPASVVKELVENSLDAGARRVEIAVEQGGTRLIRIVDDGAGMDADDLQRCILPHATSKLRTEDDLFDIRTLGFRGEALPSIGAVAQLRILSRQAGCDAAHEIRVIGGRHEPLTAAAGPPGTTVEVRELFYNVPARRKFLRSAQTEMGHVTEQLARIALVQPGVEFRLLHNERQLHHLRSAEGLRSRIADFYGKEMADSLLDIHRDERGLKIHGLIAPPADSRSSNKWQYFFLNGRFIRDRFIAAALREAYRGLMEPSRHPVAFLALEIDPAVIDVNVHPTKIEVRWRDSNTIYTQVLSAIRDRFLNCDLTNRLTAAPLFASSPTDRSRDPVDHHSLTTVEHDVHDTRSRQIRESIAEYFRRVTPTVGAPPTRLDTSFPSVSAATSGGDFTADLTAAMPAPAMKSESAGQPRMNLALESPPLGNIIQIHRSYLVAETPDGLVVVDQHALHERVLFEKISAQVRSGPLESQRMLIPEPIDVSPDQLAVIETHAETIHQLGFELTPYGPNSIAIHAAPTLLREGRMIEFVRDMIDRLTVRESPAAADMLLNDLISMMSCKAAVKAGDPLSVAEMRELMTLRESVERSSNCPHGRPTSLRFTLNDLEKQFKRT